MSFKRIHLKITSGPIETGRDLDAMCGRTIRKAQPVPLNEEVPDPLDHPQLCGRCKIRGQKENEMWGKSFSYGMVDGEESIRESE